MKTSELAGAALDWAAAKCEGLKFRKWQTWAAYSSDWAQGGPIIEREGIAIDFDGEAWTASINERPICHRASTPLIAAMRCFVASKLGDEVEIPMEITE